MSNDYWSKKHWLAIIRQRADRAGVPFDLTVDDVVVPEFCPVLGIKLERAKGRKGPSSSSPTVDRIDPALGYVRGNVRVVSQRANTMRGRRTPEEAWKATGRHTCLTRYPTQEERDEVERHRLLVAIWMTYGDGANPSHL